MTTPDDVLGMIGDHEARFVDLRFCDTKGKEQHVTVPAHQVDADLFTEGKMFDGSSIAGWKAINESDMILMPDPATAVMDIFREVPTLILRCDVVEPGTGEGYERDPRTIGKRALGYLNETGIGDVAYFGPENEFFIFDGVRYTDTMNKSSYEIISREGAWGNDDEGNLGHRPGVKGGYFPVPPVDSFLDLRSEICLNLEAMGLPVEVHHHEVATAGQAEIGVGFADLIGKADAVLMLKYVAMSTAARHGKSVTFMPKPLVGDNGNGMHVHQSIAKDGENLFTGDAYAGMISQTALHYIGGIIKHGKALNAFTNASTNSYKRLVPGFEAPTILTYSARNRSAAIRIPWITNVKARRIEVRFPDSTANPYFSFAAMLMAGIDGIQNQIDPGEALEQDLYELTSEEEAALPTVAFSLDEAMAALDADRDFLTAGDVFTNDMLDAYMELKGEEIGRIRRSTHPAEFEMYYSL